MANREEVSLFTSSSVSRRCGSLQARALRQWPEVK
jgi:hypothetical protein